MIVMACSKIGMPCSTPQDDSFEMWSQVEDDAARVAWLRRQIADYVIIPGKQNYLAERDQRALDFLLRCIGEGTGKAQRHDAAHGIVDGRLTAIERRNYEDGELSREATTEDSSVVQTDGSREVQPPLPPAPAPDAAAYHIAGSNKMILPAPVALAPMPPQAPPPPPDPMPWPEEDELQDRDWRLRRDLC
jgi:hypothetical protein